MADYLSATRTGYFRVTDEKRYQELFSGLSSFGDEIEDISKKNDEGNLWHGFASYGEVDYFHPDDKYQDDPDTDWFYDELSKIIVPGDACVITSAGHEKLCFVDGYVAVIMHNKVECSSLCSEAIRIMENAGIDPKKIEMSY